MAWPSLVCDPGSQLAGLASWEDQIYTVSSASGEVKVFQENDGNKEKLALVACTEGVSMSLAYDRTGVLFVTDFANKCIKSKEPSDTDFQMLIGEYEGKPFHGPNSLCFDKDGTLFFTDSGPMGDTSLARPKGSVYCVNVDESILKPLAHECLAYPSGIAVSSDGNQIYVSEMMANRIIRFVKRPNNVFYSSVFYTFSGCFGPSALAWDEKESRLYVACYEFSGVKDGENALNGRIAVIGSDGKLVAETEAPGPEVMGILVLADEVLVSEQSTSSIYSVPKTALTTV